MPIFGVSEYKRLPRLGKIKLGKKDGKKNGAPLQTKYFICPEAVQAVYGKTPTELDIMFPLDDQEIVFPQYRKQYGQTGLKCKGDGRSAMAMVDGRLIERACTPDAPECSGCRPIGILNLLLPQVPGFGVWQIWTGSWNSIVNLNSGLDMIRTITGGRIAFIPLKLQLRAHQATVNRKGKQVKKKVYVLTLKIDRTLAEFCDEHSADAQFRQALRDPQFRQLANVTAKIADLNRGAAGRRE